MAKTKKEEIVEKDLKTAEIKAEKEAELDKEMNSDQEEPTDQEIDEINTEKKTGTNEQLPSEVAAINEDTTTAKAATRGAEKVEEKKATKTKQSKQSKKTAQKKVKSKKYTEAIKDFDQRKLHQIEEAIEQVKKLSYSKFDGTITLDVKLAKAKKEEESVRGTIKLPHPTGKTQKVKVASEDLIEQIKKGKTDFDILLTTPAMMPKLAVVAKILGPKGKMPNPKDGTVVENPEEAMKEIEQTVRYRMDAGRNLHIPIGKVSTKSSKLAENLSVVLKAITHLKKDSLTLSPTMGPGVKISLSVK